MATALDIVTRANRKLNLSAQGSTLPAAEAAEGLDALNMMLAAWKLAGVDAGHMAIDLTDDFPLGPEFEEGAVYILAGRISSDYQAPVGFDADDWFRKIQAAYMVIDEAAIPETLLYMPSQAWFRNTVG